jgi:hypothetical protein
LVLTVVWHLISLSCGGSNVLIMYWWYKRQTSSSIGGIFINCNSPMLQKLVRPWAYRPNRRHIIDPLHVTSWGTCSGLWATLEDYWTSMHNYYYGENVQRLPLPSLDTRRLPPQHSVLSGWTRGGMVWETAYTVLDPCGQSDCGTRVTSHVWILYHHTILSLLTRKSVPPHYCSPDLVLIQEGKSVPLHSSLPGD